MNYLSVCSGVEAATVAWHELGWKPLAFSEIEKFPSEVLAHHYPGVPNLGDMTKYKEWNFGDKSIDVVVGGTPCQSFSVAGLRKGLEDPRGNLALTFCGILDKFRPQWFIWENVPGVLSSGGGRDFGSFLGAVAELGYGFSYRVLDAQNFGVPQRRRRVFVVGHLGDWRPAAEVLFEPESLSRHTEESRKKRKDTPRDTALGIDTSGPLQTRDYKGLNSDSLDKKAIVEVFEYHPNDSRVKEMGDTCQTVTSRWGTGGGNIPIAIDSVAYSIREDATKNNMSITKLDVSNCLSSHQPSIMSHHAQTFIQDMAVRKLTLTECERLQGFPDGYTNIKESCPDGHRYKAMGNSMAVPVMRWIGKRIEDRR
jgi:DNA (cytosine-5)-methyltransferase 1